MSKKKGYQNRLRLFNHGNTRCPICLTQFTKCAVEKGLDVTLEHVPPKTLGGSVRCLTCVECNRSAGRSLDQAAAMRNSAIKDLQAGRGAKVELDVCGTKHTTYFSTDGITKDSRAGRLANSPNAKRLLTELSGHKLLLLAELKRGPVWDVSKGITITIKRPPENHVAVSWLRSAYLLVFSLLGPAGYQYAESDSIRPIREQIMKPDDEIVPYLLCDVSHLQVPQELIIMNNWQQPFCWIVKIGSMGVLLPHGGTTEHYKEVVEMPDQIKPLGLRGWKPTTFGTSFSCELSLRKDSDHADKDLFGQVFKVSHDESERQCIVVNQQGLLCTIMPFDSPKMRSNC